MPIKKRSEITSSGGADMKYCPFCDNEIRVKAIKCQYCGEFLNKPGNMKENVTNDKHYDYGITGNGPKGFFTNMWENFKEGFNAGKR